MATSRINSILLSILLIVSATLSAQTDKIRVEKLKRDITYLSSEKLGGRKPGTEGDSLAAIYIRNSFVENGAKLLETNGFQYFGIVSDIKSGNNNRFLVSDTEFVAGKDFQPFSFSGSETVEAGVMFAGFGISGISGDLKWDDFENKDLKGKWVLVLRGDPEPENAASAFIPMATDRAKALNVRDKGAAGLLLVSPSSIDKMDQPIDITFDKSVSDAGIPVISITRNTASFILGLKPNAIDSLEKSMISNKEPARIDLKTRINATTDILRQRVATRNIMAVVPGNDPGLMDEYIVIGAHHDHLGMGGSGSGSRAPDLHAVHGGADDNASGVAALIDLAGYFSDKANRPGRSLLFVSFGAEEMGILGSKYFISHCPVDVKSIKAMINIDMIGRLNSETPTLNISGTGTFTAADSLLDRLSVNRSFQVKKSPDGYGPSDHASFYGEGIPVLFLTTGAHEDYHTPDDLASRINSDGELKVIDYAADLIQELSYMKPAPFFREAGSRREGGQYGRGLKVTLGIMPDVSGAETSGGMKVEGTRKDGPAQKAGMIKGDIITAINGMPVSNIYDYMTRLGKLKPGEIINVEVLRDGEKEILIIQL